MANLISSSIGKKLVMSLSGLFLIMFLCVHLGVNSLLLFDNTGELFNWGCKFMTNPVIKVIEPILALGFIIHIVWASILTIQNRKARPVKYAVRNQSQNSEWSSRNMYVLGALLIVFILIHLVNFWSAIKFGQGWPGGAMEEITYDGTTMENVYPHIVDTFRNPLLAILYVAAGILLGLHLSHGFWSLFQSVGLCNGIWRPRLEFIAKIFAIIVALGFAIIPLFFLFGLDKCSGI